MIKLDLKLDGKIQKVQLKDEVLFNSILRMNTTLIKKFIKSIHPTYKISSAFFQIVNNYIDFTSNGVSIYVGLIVRTGLDDYAVLYLEGSHIEEEYMLKIIDEFIRDTGDHTPKEININKFEVRKELFLASISNM